MKPRRYSMRIRRRGLEAEFYEYSTLHGISDLYRARNWCMRLLWLNLFVGAIIGAVYGCSAIVMEYIAQPVVVSLFVREGDNMTLPDVVVCPFNRFNRSFFEVYNISNDVAQYLEMSFPSPPILDFQTQEFYRLLNDKDILEGELDKVLERLKMNFTEFIQFASDFDCSQIVRAIKYSDYRVLDCRDLPTVMTSAGKCFIVPGRAQKAAGFNQGVRVTISLPHNYFNPGVNQLLLDGIAVKLAEKDKGQNADLFFVPAGVHAIMPLRATRYEFMNVRDDFFQCLQNPTPGYSRLGCFESCIVENGENVCNCSLAGSRTPRMPLCRPRDIYECYTQVLSKNTDYEKCRHRCKQPCGYWQYQATVTYAKFPSPEAKHFVPDNETWEQLENTIILEVFFENLEYTLINHVEKHTVYSFIAQIGGQVSLWSGGSILTLLQLVIFLFQIIHEKCFTESQRTESHESNSWDHSENHRNHTNALLQNHIDHTEQRRPTDMTSLSMQPSSNYCLMSSSDLNLSSRGRLEALV